VASFHLASGSPEDAARWVDRALDLAERGEHRSAVAGALVVRGRIEAARGEPERARESLRGAADIFGELGYEAELSRTRNLLEDLPTP
jgi:hypothetical protein